MATALAEELDPTKQAELDRFIDDIRQKDLPESYLIAVLHKTQDLYGYLPRHAVQHVAKRMELPVSRIWGVCTFYHYFNLKPRGKFMISVCLGTACYVKGSPRVLDAIREDLKIDIGETTGDKMFTLLETRCLGACGLAPTMMINNRIHGRLTPKKALEILQDYRKKGAKEKEGRK